MGGNPQSSTHKERMAKGIQARRTVRAESCSTCVEAGDSPAGPFTPRETAGEPTAEGRGALPAATRSFAKVHTRFGRPPRRKARGQSMAGGAEGGSTRL